MVTLLTGCETFWAILNTANENLDLEPTSTEMAGGLKDALLQGTGFAVNTLSAVGGYANDPKVRIPFPAEAQNVADKMRQIGLGSLIDNLEVKINEGAEKGAKMALPIFKDAITQMTFADAKNILLGPENAATQYFQNRTTTQLTTAFRPHIKSSLDEVKATDLWTEITTQYNKIPFVQKVNTDLVGYATEMALKGLFQKVALEELKIRDNVAARKTDLLKKVFDYADKQKAASN